MEKIVIDGQQFVNKADAEKYVQARMSGNTLLAERMTFAWCKLQEGFNVIDTRTRYAVKPEWC